MDLQCFRIPNSYSLVDLLGDIAEQFLYRPQPLGTNYNGRFVPLNITIPDAAPEVGCLGLSLLASATPDETEPVVQAASALENQIFSVVLGAAACGISKYEIPSGPNYAVAGENTDAGSGSGIIHKGEWDSQTEIPTGLSTGDQL